MSDLTEEFELQRPKLFGLAYRLLGSASEAEDALQNAYLRSHAADRTAIRSLPAWLTKTLTNLCLNELTSARARRESYAVPWLPEPVIVSPESPRSPCTASWCVPRSPRICCSRFRTCCSTSRATTITRRRRRSGKRRR
jgi:DNA-directed RNA polymerase specialized sigma24 family protein